MNNIKFSIKLMVASIALFSVNISIFAVADRRDPRNRQCFGKPFAPYKKPLAKNLIQAIQNIEVATVEKICKESPNQVNAPNKLGHYPIHEAVLSITKSPVDNAFDILISLLDAKVDINTQTLGDLYTPLHLLYLHSKKEVNKELLDLLLAYGADPSLEDKNRHTPIDLKGHPDIDTDEVDYDEEQLPYEFKKIVIIIISSVIFIYPSADPEDKANETFYSSFDKFLRAIHDRKLMLTNKMCQEKIEMVNKRDRHGDHTVHHAIMAIVDYPKDMAAKNILSVLLEAGIDVNAQSGLKQRAPLHIAYLYDLDECIIFLLIAFGADQDIEDADGYKPIELKDAENESEQSFWGKIMYTLIGT